MEEGRGDLAHECMGGSLFLSVLNKYRKRRVHNTANLLTGEADVAPGSIKVREKDSFPG